MPDILQVNSNNKSSCLHNICYGNVSNRYIVNGWAVWCKSGNGLYPPPTLWFFKKWLAQIPILPPKIFSNFPTFFTQSTQKPHKILRLFTIFLCHNSHRTMQFYIFLYNFTIFLFTNYHRTNNFCDFFCRFLIFYDFFYVVTANAL